MRNETDNDKTQNSSFADSQYRDPLFNFCAPEILEGWVNSGAGSSAPGEFLPRPGYEHLKTVKIDLERANLTDKQLTAVSLVFYGGARKKRAARAMNITSQALTDHLNAALKKIQKSLG